jgi:hypothetical protein
MVKVVVNDTQGLVQSAGSSLHIDNLINARGGASLTRAGAAENGPIGFVVGKHSSPHATVDPYAQGTTQLWPLGTRLVYGDRQFVYARMGASVTAGKLVQAAVHQGADHLDMDITTGDVPAIGDYRISLETNGTDLTKDQYADGYIYVNDGTGEGQLMKIKSHAAHSHSGDPTCVFTLYDPVTVALVAGGTSKVTIHQNKHYKVVLATHAETSALVGVTVRNSTDDNFAWLQVSGPAAVLTRGTVVVGNNVIRAVASVNGAVQADPANIGAVATSVGEVMVVNVDTDYSLIDLRIGF